MRFGRAAAVAGVVLALAGSAWAVGFAAFVGEARRDVAGPPDADGIVVLTGGASRIEAGLRLLAEGRAPVLLISGVGGRSDLADLARGAQPGVDAASFEERVTIGHEATSTSGNAAEAEAWARRHAMRRLIVVTAGYHMRRALLEIGRRLPDVALYPAPVQPPALRGALDLATLRLLCVEYDKWLAVRLGLSPLWSRASP